HADYSVRRRNALRQNNTRQSRKTSRTNPDTFHGEIASLPSAKISSVPEVSPGDHGHEILTGRVSNGAPGTMFQRAWPHPPGSRRRAAKRAHSPASNRHTNSARGLRRTGPPRQRTAAQAP